MGIIGRSLTFLLGLTLLFGCLTVAHIPEEKLAYPPAKKGSICDNYHGTKVADPYRWLEDEAGEGTRQWIGAQGNLTSHWLSEVLCRPQLKKRLSELWNYEKWGLPRRRGGRYFFTRNDGLQNQGVLYWAESLTAEPRVLLDPNTLSADGTVALARYSISRDGEWLAYGLSRGGSDWNEWFVRRVDTGKDLPDRIKWTKFTRAAWDGASKGFYYSRYAAPVKGKELSASVYYQELYYHALGTPQVEDRLIYQRQDKKTWGFGAQVTDDGRYLLIRVGRGSERKNLVFYRDLQEKEGPIRELIVKFTASYRFIDNDGSRLWFFTDQDAPKGKVIAIDLKQPKPEKWQTIIPEGRDTLEGANVLHDQFVAFYLRDACSAVKTFDLTGRFIKELILPGRGSVYGFGGRRQDRETFFKYVSLNDPGTVYSFDMATGGQAEFKQPKLAFQPAGYVTNQVFYSSHDGTRVPMFLGHRRGLRITEKTPVLLYGYGGFNVSLSPSFKVFWLVWMEMGGVVAVANIRGGGEYGKAWHVAGMKRRKQNVFNDFIAAAEWLIENKYTSRAKLAISGASNGGLLVGACMTQRPDLFGACLPAVGVMDMLRFPLFTIGWAWVSDYGSPNDPEDFRVLHAYSPYHNIEDGVSYPPTFVTTADHDDRVVPAHSFKFTARLQAAQGGTAPILIRIETRAGHGRGKATKKQISEAADKLAFLVRSLRLDW